MTEPDFKKSSADGLAWIMTEAEKSQERYMVNERYLLKIAQMRWWQRLFLARKILNHLDETAENYRDYWKKEKKWAKNT